VHSGGPPLPHILCQRVSEPCGSASINRMEGSRRCTCAAKRAASVLLPAPPLYDAKTMTFMRAPRQGHQPSGQRNRFAFFGEVASRPPTVRRKLSPSGENISAAGVGQASSFGNTQPPLFKTSVTEAIYNKQTGRLMNHVPVYLEGSFDGSPTSAPKLPLFSVFRARNISINTVWRYPVGNDRIRGCFNTALVDQLFDSRSLTNSKPTCGA
jgi:hypothetical protein